MTVGVGSMNIVDVDEPVVAAGEARILVGAVGLCGSDYHLFRGTHPYVHYPQTQGHEFSGTVLELAPDYVGALRVGETVAIDPTRPCGACFACRRGRSNCCSSLKVMGAHIPGALAEQVVVPVSALHSTAGLDAELGALVEPMTVGLQAVLRGQVAEGDTVVIIGAGPIGLAACLAANDIGARVLVADRVASRLELARMTGAERTVDTSAEDLAAAVRDFTSADGAAVVIDATGVPQLIRAAFDIVASAGAIVIVGISDGEVAIPVIEFSRKEVSVYGSRNSTGLFPQAIELVRRYPDWVRSWVSHRIALDEVPAMIEFAMAHPESVQKVLVTMEESK